MDWVLFAGFAMVAAWLVFRNRKAPPVRAILVLLRHPWNLEPERLRAAAERVGVRFEIDREGPPTWIKLNGLPFLLIVSDGPYLPPGWSMDRLTEAIPEARLREAVREHVAFFSLNASQSLKDEDWEQGLSLASKVVGEIADEDTLVIWCTDTNQAARFTEDVRESLREGKIREVTGYFQGDEVIDVAQDDPRMVAAVKEARERWPEFVAAVHRLNDSEMTIVKAPFTDGDHTEHMWVAVEQADAEGASGKLMNRPFRVRGLKQGQDVRVLAEEIDDWSFLENDEPHGMFTDRIIRGLPD